MGSHTNTVSQKNATVETLRKVEFRSVFRAPSQKFKILAIPNVLAHGKSYEHGFAKKRDSHKLCAKSSFNQFFVYRLKKFKMMAIPNVLTLSQKLKILVIPNVLAHEKSYEHDFMKKCDGHKLCAKSIISKNSKYWLFQTY
ncbi:hypothetical protein BHM03_00002754 [Ensete ventricosum]|nr:hypothetical protein BHM03_00002754 [Ensete ventricosum]